MKDLKKLKLKDIVETPMNVSEMANLTAGINDDIMPAAYGCNNQVCTDNRSESIKECSTAKCKDTACESGA